MHDELYLVSATSRCALACPCPHPLLNIPPIGCRLEPWLAVALFLLHERAKGPASRWAPYLAALPADAGSPVQWGEEDLQELQGSQALQTAMAYRCVHVWMGRSGVCRTECCCVGDTAAGRGRGLHGSVGRCVFLL